ncbi:MAG: hypothetical protein Q7V12_00420 [Deltaproteobacteria bacterium]|jgi:hypothetical protein|nr:hypothetical protein [Deltaproteobacteria bacterium]MDP2972595.1 hypothetical protein [Deltaproteobacteria bacterium]
MDRVSQNLLLGLLKASVYRSLATLQKEDGNMAKAQKYQIMAETLDKEE